MKTIKLQRISDNGISTIGKLIIDDLEFVTIEDTFRKEKIYGKTRIPAGIYNIKLRKVGLHHEKYSKKFAFHRGMLWLQDVPNFNNILIHIGNTADDTAGCILVGEKIQNSDKIINSAIAYTKLYKYLLQYFETGEEININIIDN